MLAIRPALLIGLFLCVAGSNIAPAADTSSNLIGTTWRPLRIGAGGFLTGIDISADGSTRVVRTDTYGAYIWNAAISQWIQLVTKGSMPAVDRGVDNNGGGQHNFCDVTLFRRESDHASQRSCGLVRSNN